MFDFVCCDASGVSITNLYQWDVGIYLYVPDWESGTPAVHFCNKNSDTVIPMPSTIEDGKLKVKIPDILLQEASTLFAYFYMGDADGGMRTVHAVQIPVRKRLKPEDYEYEEDTDTGLALTEAMLKVDSRISNLIKAMSNNPDAAANAELVDIRVGNDGTVYTCAGDAVRAIAADLDLAKIELKKYAESVSNIAGLKYEDSILSLVDADGNEVGDSVTITGGQGGGGGNVTWRVRNAMEGTAFTIPKGGSMILSFTYQSVEDGQPNGGSADVYVNGAKRTTVPIVEPTAEAVQVDVDISKFLTVGTSTIKIRVTDGMNTKVLNYTIEVIDLSITSTFDETQVYSDDIQVRYTPYGALDKNIIFELDGNQIASIANSGTGKQSLYVIPADSLTYGSHNLRIWMEATLNGSTIKSNVLSYGLIFDNGSKNVIISSGFTQTEADEGDVISIPYLIYTPGYLTSTATLTIKNPDGSVYSETELSGVERKQYYWNIRKYPTGEGVKFIISSGSGSTGATKEFTLNITKSDIQIDVVDADGSAGSLKLRLDALGKGNSDANRESWIEDISGDNVATMTMFNYQTNGWIDDALEVSGNAKAELDLELFSSDFKNSGRTIEIEFETKDVKNADTVIFECKSGSIGIVATPQQFTFSGSTTSVSVLYREEERIRIGIVIEPTNGNEPFSENRARLIHVYVNGIDSGVTQYSKNENFEQGVVKPLTVGSTECTTRLYSVLEYNVALTRYQMFNNFMADRDSLEEKREIQGRNNIYDEDGYNTIVFDYLNGKLPCMILTGALPQYKGDKRFMDVDYTDTDNPENDFHWKNALMNVQGTSSQYYPRKNYKLNSVKDKKDVQKVVKTTVDSEGNEKPSFCLNPEYILPCRDFCLKADFAESSGTHNTGLAKLIPSLYTAQTPPQADNPDKPIRTTVYGFPICVFYRETENDTPTFLGKYNFNSDKGAEKTFGFDKETYPNSECWELKNNYSMRTVWLSDNYEDDPVLGKVTDDFERRFPDEDDEEYPVDYTNLRRVASWLASTAVEDSYDEKYENYVSKPTGAALQEAVTYDGVEYTNDTAEYRLAKFKAEFSQYFNMDYCLVYYICALFFAMADSRAKNMMLATWDGMIWFPIFYDMDTVLGINNQGEIAYKYNVEFQDIVAAQDVFNGRLSVLWNNFGACFADRIQEKYNQIRQGNNIFNFNVFMNYFETQQSDKWCESIYNEDGNTKYIIPAIEGAEYTNPDDVSGAKIPAAQFLVDLQGSRKSHRYWWLKNRLSYIDSKYLAYGITTDTMTMRVNTPRVWAGVAPSSIFNITPYIDLYCWARYGASSTPIGERGYQNEVCTVDPGQAYNNVETTLFGASLLSDIGDISDKYASSIDASKAIRLSRLIVGSSKRGYSNPNLTKLVVGTNKLMREINVENCPALKDNIDVSGCENIQKVFARGSSVKGVDLPPSGYLTDFELPDTIVDLFVYNQQYITNFKIDGTSHLERLMIQNCRGIPSADIVTYTPSIKWINLTGVDWTENGDGILQSSNALRRLLTIEKGVTRNDGGVFNTEDPIASGNVYCKTNASGIKTALSSKFPELNITWGTATEYKVDFVDGDGNIIATEYVAKNDPATDPSTREINPIIPTKADEEYYSYAFSGWDVDFSNVTSNMTVTAQFEQTARTCTVTFRDLASSTEMITRVILNGTATPPFSPAAILKKADTELDYDQVFAGWQSSDPDLEMNDLTVTGNVTFTSVYSAIVIPDMSTGQYNFATMNWGQIRAVAYDPESRYNAATGYYTCKYNGVEYNAFQVGDTKTVTLSDGTVITWEIKDLHNANDDKGDLVYELDENYEIKTDSSGSPITRRAPITMVMKYAYPTKKAMNASDRYYFDYALGGKSFKAYSTANSESKVTATGTSVTLKIKDYSYITSISNGETTWYFNSTVDDTANGKYGLISHVSDIVQKGTFVLGDAEDESKQLKFTVNGGAVVFNYNNDNNTVSTTGQAELRNGCTITIPCEAGDIITVTNAHSYNNGGYVNSEYRQWVNGTLLPLFPDIFKNCISLSTQNVNLGFFSKSVVAFEDYLYPLSTMQVGGSSSVDAYTAQGTAYQGFPDANSRKKYMNAADEANATNAQTWWLRTITITPQLQQQNPAFYFGISKNGYIINYYADDKFYQASALHAVVLGCVI